MSASVPLQTVQAIYAAFGRGDIPALLEQLHADVNWRFIGDAAAPYSRSVQGHEGVMACTVCSGTDALMSFLLSWRRYARARAHRMHRRPPSPQPYRATPCPSEKST